MSWWSDGEPFDEWDPPWCDFCPGGTSKEECDRCTEYHLKDMRAEEDYDEDLQDEEAMDSEDDFEDDDIYDDEDDEEEQKTKGVCQQVIGMLRKK